MKISGRTQPLAHYPALESLEIIKARGFEGVEICLENADMAPEILTPAKIRAVREKVHDLDLAPHSISYHQDYVNSDAAFELTKAAIRMTPEFGTDLFVFSGPARRTDDPSEWEEMIVRTRSLADIAERYGVILAEEFEPKFVVGSMADLLRLFEEVGSPALAANLDLGHLSSATPIPSRRSTRSVTGSLIATSRIWRGVCTTTFCHKRVTWISCSTCRHWQDVGYAGPLSLDLYKYDYEAIAPDAIAYIRGCWTK